MSSLARAVGDTETPRRQPLSLGSPQVIAGLVCQEQCLARVLQARRCSAGVLKDRKEEGVKGGSRNRMAEWGGGAPCILPIVQGPERLHRGRDGKMA